MREEWIFEKQIRASRFCIGRNVKLMRDVRIEPFKDWLQSFIEAGAIMLILFVFLWPAKVEGVSMSPSVNNGDRVAICRLAAKAKLYGRGDIVVFNSDDYTENMIKRVIAVGGDTIHITNGLVYVNGELLEEDYAHGYTDGDIYMSVESGHVFVMGDNREKSIDSRSFGTIEADDIYGRVILRFFPFNKITIFV